jgi:triphosphoribosyl-dephospho-CoA synthase
MFSALKVADHVSRCLQLAILLEVSAYPKPGNVHRTADFRGTRYEHFLASAVAVEPHFRRAARRGVMVSAGKIGLKKMGIGAVIRDAIQDVSGWQHGGNTLLGSIILLSPMAAAAGMTSAENSFSITMFRENVKRVVESTTPLDAVALYDAIAIANPGGLGEAPKLDVTDPASKKRILDDRVTLFDVFKIASEWDSIASEWVNNYHITFDLGYPYFIQQLQGVGEINVATVHTFLKILSEVPDTLVARKVGLTKAKEVSMQAKHVLEIGGLLTMEGRGSLWALDGDLRKTSHKLNPGTTADITAAVLAVSILNKYRP